MSPFSRAASPVFRTLTKRCWPGRHVPATILTTRWKSAAGLGVAVGVAVAVGVDVASGVAVDVGVGVGDGIVLVTGRIAGLPVMPSPVSGTHPETRESGTNTENQEASGLRPMTSTSLLVGNSDTVRYSGPGPSLIATEAIDRAMSPVLLVGVTSSATAPLT
jgi:hypothetical protein